MKKKSRKRRYIIISILLALAGGGAWMLRPKVPVKLVLAAKVEKLEELKAIVNGSGEIRTKDSVDIQTEIAGVIVELLVQEGDKVQKDQVLLRIDPFQTRTDVDSAKSQLAALEAETAGQTFQIASAQANIARDEFLKKSAEVERRQADANLSRAREAYSREKKLLAEKLTSPDQFELAETTFKVNEAQVEAAMARIDQLEAQIKATKANLEYAKSSREAFQRRVEGARSSLERTDDMLRKTTIRSPLDGVVVKLNVEAGERAVPGILSNPQATLMTIADLRIIESEMKVDETDIVNVEIGNIGRVEVDALPDTPLTGKVIEIGNSPILSTSGSQEGKDFKVVLRIQDPPSSLRPGMSCQADITTKVLQDVPVVPIQALTLREVPVDGSGNYLPPPKDAKKGPPPTGAAVADSPPEKRKELQGVYLVGTDGMARFRPVKTGTTGEMDTELLSGLAVGDEVVVGPLKILRALEEGDRIEVDRTKPFRRSAKKRGAAQKDEDSEK